MPTLYACSDSLAFATEPVFTSLANLLGHQERMPTTIPQEIKVGHVRVRPEGQLTPAARLRACVPSGSMSEMDTSKSSLIGLCFLWQNKAYEGSSLTGSLGHLNGIWGITTSLFHYFDRHWRKMKQ